MSNTLNITARFDRNNISSDEGASHYLLIDTLANSIEPGSNKTESPLNLALVIDASGSMEGDRLLFAKKAAAGIIKRLTKNDRISLVSFDDTARVHIDGIACDEGGRRAAMNAVEKIVCGGSTNLSEGWFKGAECVGVVMEQYPQCSNAVIVLSDGHANKGTVNPVALGRDAAQLQARGLSSSTVGVGDGYSTSQLMAIALNGGGTLHHAPRPEEIIEVVMGELDDLRNRAISNLMVKVDFPADSIVELLGLSPCEFDGSSMTCFLGGLPAGASRSLVLRIAGGSELRTNALSFKVTASWLTPGSSELVTGNAMTVKLKCASKTAGDNGAIDLAASLAIVKLWQAFIVWKVADFNRERNYHKIKQFLNRELSELRSFCARVPEAASSLAEVEQLFTVAFKEWGEGQRKEVQYSSYMTSQSQTDKRSRAHQDWKDHLQS